MQPYRPEVAASSSLTARSSHASSTPAHVLKHKWIPDWNDPVQVRLRLAKDKHNAREKIRRAAKAKAAALAAPVAKAKSEASQPRVL